jgi:hypothetical protein
MKKVQARNPPGVRWITPLFQSFVTGAILFALFLASCTIPGEDSKDGGSLSVLNVTPNGKDPVDPGTTFIVEFNKAIDFEALIHTTGWNGINVEPAVTLEVTYDEAEKKLFIEPSPCLDCGTTYAITLKKTITGIDGSCLLNNYTWSFSTIEAPAGDIQINEIGTADSPHDDSTVTLTIACNYAAKKYKLWDGSPTPPDWAEWQPVKHISPDGIIVLQNVAYTFIDAKTDGEYTVQIQFRDDGVYPRLSLVRSASIFLQIQKIPGGK